MPWNKFLIFYLCIFRLFRLLPLLLFPFLFLPRFLLKVLVLEKHIKVVYTRTRTHACTSSISPENASLLIFYLFISFINFSFRFFRYFYAAAAVVVMSYSLIFLPFRVFSLLFKIYSHYLHEMCIESVKMRCMIMLVFGPFMAVLLLLLLLMPLLLLQTMDTKAIITLIMHTIRGVSTAQHNAYTELRCVSNQYLFAEHNAIYCCIARYTNHPRSKRHVESETKRKSVLWRFLRSNRCSCVCVQNFFAHRQDTQCIRPINEQNECKPNNNKKAKRNNFKVCNHNAIIKSIIYARTILRLWLTEK